MITYSLSPLVLSFLINIPKYESWTHYPSQNWIWRRSTSYGFIRRVHSDVYIGDLDYIFNFNIIYLEGFIFYFVLWVKHFGKLRVHVHGRIIRNINLIKTSITFNLFFFEITLFCKHKNFFVLYGDTETL